MKQATQRLFQFSLEGENTVKGLHPTKSIDEERLRRYALLRQSNS
jgi:hypothetical protein